MKVAVLGAGSWGTTIAVHLADKGEDVFLWDNDREHIERLSGLRENRKHLPSVKIPRSVSISPELEDALDAAEVYVLAVPSHAVREVSKKASLLVREPEVLSVSKGLECGSLKRLSEVIGEEMPRAVVSVLSGPSHAEEVSRKMPCTVVVSSKEMPAARRMQKLFMTESFRVYTNSDIMGVELGGALKNVIAIACGISDGLGFGDNTKAALLTRGLVEMSRLGVAMGAVMGTFSGLAGMGDLFTTCASRHSRNRKFGELLAKGIDVEEALNRIGQVVEGLRTCECAVKIAENYGVEMPIAEQVHEVIFKGKCPREAASDLMLRMPRAEQEDNLFGGGRK